MTKANLTFEDRLASVRGNKRSARTRCATTTCREYNHRREYTLRYKRTRCPTTTAMHKS